MADVLLPQHLLKRWHKYQQDWRQHKDQLHPFTLRFLDAGTEEAFLEDRKNSLVIATLIFSCVMFFFLSVDVVLSFNKVVWEEGIPSYVALKLFVALLSGSAFSLLLTRKIVNLVKVAWLETLFAVKIMLLLAIVLVTPKEWTPPPLRNSKCMTAAALVNVLHACVPIRWYISSVGVLAILIIGIVRHAPTVTVSLAMTLAGAAILRSHDLTSRLLYLRTVEVEIPRIVIEHRGDTKGERKSEQLPAVGCMPSMTSSGGDPCQSQQNSVPDSCGRQSGLSTTDTGRLFNSLHDCQVNPEVGLSRLAQLGRLEQWSINPQDLTILLEEPLGRGGFGKVTRAVWLGMLVAVKVPCKRVCTCKADLRKLPTLANELRILRHLRHPNLVLMHGAVIQPDDQTMGIVMELVDGITLDKFIYGEKPGHVHRYQLMVGTAAGLLYLHSHNPQITHGDLKPQNVLVERTSIGVHPKLVDFGLSRVISRRPLPLGGTLGWMAPEIFQQHSPVRCSADLYAYGCLLGFIAAGVSLTQKCRRSTLRRALRRGAIPDVPTWPKDCVFTEAFRPLVLACMEPQEHNRPALVSVHRQLLLLHRALDLSEAPFSFLRQIQTLAKACEQADIAGRSGPGLAPQREDDESSVGSEGGLTLAICKTSSICTKGVSRGLAPVEGLVMTL